MNIRKYKTSDWEMLWPILEDVFRRGDTYSFSPEITETEARRVWVQVPAAVFVALNEQDEVAGTYYIKPNQPELGAHVCNCGYIVAARARGGGIASAMCRHSQQEAKKMGFRAMQFNLVVTSNTGAVRLWRKHGFNIVGTLPQAFNHRKLGYVDALIMYKLLV